MTPLGGHGGGGRRGAGLESRKGENKNKSPGDVGESGLGGDHYFPTPQSPIQHLVQSSLKSKKCKLPTRLKIQNDLNKAHEMNTFPAIKKMHRCCYLTV